MSHARYVLIASLALVLSACGIGSNEPDVPNIEDAEFDASLNVDLSAMTQTDSGLYYRDLEDGSGAEAEAGDTVAVRYSGWLIDGTQFDSNVDNDESFLFVLGTGGVIPGFEQGATGMQEGGERQIIIPPELGYGSQGSGPIPPNSILVFNIELEEIVVEEESEE